MASEKQSNLTKYSSIIIALITLSGVIYTAIPKQKNIAVSIIAELRQVIEERNKKIEHLESRIDLIEERLNQCLDKLRGDV